MATEFNDVPAYCIVSPFLSRVDSFSLAGPCEYASQHKDWNDVYRVFNLSFLAETGADAIPAVSLKGPSQTFLVPRIQGYSLSLGPGAL